MRAPETSQTLDRGLQVLMLVAAEGGGVSVSELAGRLGVSRPAVYRLLATLEAHGLVARDGGVGPVRLGLGLLPLARAVVPRVAEVAVPLLRRLAEEMGATAHLTVAEPGSGPGPESGPESGEPGPGSGPESGSRPESGEAVAVAVVEPTHTAIHAAYRVGSRHRLDRGAAGRAILAARHGGIAGGAAYVVTEGELQPGAVGIAAPVLGVPGLEASVGLVAIGQSLDPAAAGAAVVATAAALAAALREPR